MRRVVLPITPKILAQMLMGHEMSKVTTDLPPDTEIFYVRWDADRHRILLDATSAAFDDVPELAYGPERNIIATGSWTPDTATYELLRPPCPACAEHHAKGHL